MSGFLPSSDTPKPGNRSVILILGACGILIILAIIAFMVFNGRQIRDNNHNVLINDTIESANNLDRAMEEGLHNIEILGKLVSQSLTSPQVDISNYQKLIQHTTFDFMEFADKDGIDHNITGGVSDASDRQYYLDAMQGNTGVEIIYNSRATHENLLMFYSPVTYRGEIIGSLVGVFQASNRITDLLELKYFGETTQAYLCDRDGNVFASNTQLDVTQKWKLRDVLELNRANSAAVREAIRTRKPTAFLYNGSRSGGYMTKLPQMDWMLVQIYPASVNSRMIRSANANTLLLFLAVMTILIIMQYLFYKSLKKHQTELREAMEALQSVRVQESQQLNILNSIAGIYYSMHIIDLENNTATEYIAKNDVKTLMGDPGIADVAMRRIITGTITEGHLQIALDFSDLKTLSERMQDRKAIFMDLLGKHVGWIRFSFIAIETDAVGRPRRVVCTTQIIDEEKRKEEKLLKESNTDELTGCLNRRAHDDFLLSGADTAENFVYIAMDVNGLKVINDSMGHDAGDELIAGAVDCMRRCFGSYGSIFRIGGDEFAAMIRADSNTLPGILQDFEDVQSDWRGKQGNTLSVSSGYACREEFPAMPISEMVRIADQRMYTAKANYYKTKGVDRRGQSAALSALCAMYTKILRVNLTEDSYQIITMDQKEQSTAKGFAQSISGWLRGFGESSQVHPEDREQFLRETALCNLRDGFRQGKESMGFTYRRMIGNSYKLVLMELIRAKDYSDSSQNLFLFVKQLER